MSLGECRLYLHPATILHAQASLIKIDGYSFCTVLRQAGVIEKIVNKQKCSL